MRRSAAIPTVMAISAALLLMKASDVKANPTLTYDVSSFIAAPGASIQIGATLALAQTDNSFIISSANPYATIGQATDINAFLFGSPAYYFSHNSGWVPPSQDPLSNLDVPPGGSVHLDLGSIVLSTGLPNGTYTTDIGIYVACQTTFCRVSLFSPPTIDAGLLTITVAAPEPAAIFLVGTALLGLVVARRSRVQRTVAV